MPFDGDKDEAADDGEPVVAPPRRGRRPGSKNKRTVEVELALRPMLPRVKRKLAELLQSDDPETAYKALALTFGYIFGKPTERVSAEISGPDGGPVETRSELSMMEASRRIAYLLASTHHQSRGSPPELQVIEGDAERVEPHAPQPLPSPAPQPRPVYQPPPPDDDAALVARREERLASENEDFAAARQHRHPRVIMRRDR